MLGGGRGQFRRRAQLKRYLTMTQVYVRFLVTIEKDEIADFLEEIDEFSACVHYHDLITDECTQGEAVFYELATRGRDIIKPTKSKKA